MSLELRGLVRLLPQDPPIFGTYGHDPPLMSVGMSAEQEESFACHRDRPVPDTRKFYFP